MSTQTGFILSENRLKDISGTEYEIRLKGRITGMFRGFRVEFLVESRELFSGTVES